MRATDLQVDEHPRERGHGEEGAPRVDLRAGGREHSMRARAEHTEGLLRSGKNTGHLASSPARRCPPYISLGWTHLSNGGASIVAQRGL